MSQHDLIRKIERVGGAALIYEGAVLASRRIPTPFNAQVPAISDLVWLLKKRSARVAVAFGVCGYLFWHLVFGGAEA